MSQTQPEIAPQRRRGGRNWLSRRRALERQIERASQLGLDAIDGGGIVLVQRDGEALGHTTRDSLRHFLNGYEAGCGAAS